MTNRQTIWLALVACAVVPASVSADILTPLSYFTVPLLPVIIIVEALVFLLASRKWLRVKIGFRRILIAMVVANFVTSLLGTFIPLYKYVVGNLLWIAIALFLSVIVEWAICIPFFRRFRLRRLSLLALCSMTNLATYVPLAFLFMGMIL
jgi:hypothetical protein